MSDENEQSQSEKAFIDAQIGYTFQGNPLLAWSGSREIAAQAMGMKAPAWNQADLECIGEGHIYPGGLRDTIICMWICSTKNASEQTADEAKAKQWTVQRACGTPAKAYEEAEQWAIAAGIKGTSSKAFADGYKTMFAILTGVAVSQFDVHVEGQSGGGDSAGKV